MTSEGSNQEASKTQKGLPNAVDSQKNAKAERSTRSDGHSMVKAKESKPHVTKPKSEVNAKDSEPAAAAAKSKAKSTNPKPAKTEAEPKASAKEPRSAKIKAKAEASVQDPKPAESKPKSENQKKKKRPKKSKLKSQATEESTSLSAPEQSPVPNSECSNDDSSAPRTVTATAPDNVTESKLNNEPQDTIEPEQDTGPEPAKGIESSTPTEMTSINVKPPSRMPTPVASLRIDPMAEEEQSNMPEPQSPISPVSSCGSTATYTLPTSLSGSSRPPSLSGSIEPSSQHDHVGNQESDANAADASKLTIEQMMGSLPTVPETTQTETTSSGGSAPKEIQSEVPEPTQRIVSKKLKEKSAILATTPVLLEVASKKISPQDQDAPQAQRAPKFRTLEQPNATKKSVRQEPNTVPRASSPLCNQVTTVKTNGGNHRSILGALAYIAPLIDAPESSQYQADSHDLQPTATHELQLVPRLVDQPTRVHPTRLRPRLSPYANSAHYRCPEPSLSEYLVEWILANTPSTRTSVPSSVAAVPRRRPVGGYHPGVMIDSRNQLEYSPVYNEQTGQLEGQIMLRDFEESVPNTSYEGSMHSGSSLLDRSMQGFRHKFRHSRARLARWLTI